MKSVIKNIFIVILTIIACKGYTQKSWITKSKCSDTTVSGTIYTGYRLEIFYVKDNDTTKSYYYWYDNPFLTYSDSSKMLIIQQLLSLEGDTSLFCGSAGAHFYGGALSCRCHIDNNINVPLQIDALYRINAIAFPHTCHIYSCYPVLYDTLERKVINDKPELVEEVYTTYKQWFAECISNGKIGDYFPFNEGRYIWYGGRKSFYRKGE
jgi:hypothetical protein